MDIRCNVIGGTFFLTRGKPLVSLPETKAVQYNESKQESNWYTGQKISKERKQKAMSSSKPAMWKTEYPIQQPYKLPYMPVKSTATSKTVRTASQTLCWI